MAYFVAVSFLLHLISFFLIVVLLQKINATNPSTTSNDQEKLKREIEDLLIAYTTEMKEENEKLMNKITLKRKKMEQQLVHTVQSYDEMKTPIPVKNKLVQQKPTVKTVQSAGINEEDLYGPPIFEQKEDRVEQSSTAQILSLSRQGYSAKEIAKKLNMGDGEVELLLKFHK